jgi:hypothetical protein
MPRPDQEPVSVFVKLKAKRAASLLVVDGKDREVFVPLSQIQDDSEIYEASEVGDEGNLVVPAWLAIREGWE